MFEVCKLAESNVKASGFLDKKSLSKVMGCREEVMKVTKHTKQNFHNALTQGVLHQE